MFNEEDKAQTESMFSNGIQIAWMSYEHLKISDTDGAVLDNCRLLKRNRHRDGEAAR